MLLRAGLWLMAGITLGRLAGFVREAILARQFGTGPDADVAILALTLPDTILNVLIGSAMAAALIPALAEAAKREPDARSRLMTQVLVVAVALTLALQALLTWSDRWLVGLIAPGLSTTQLTTLLPLVAIALLAMPLTMASAVYGAGLQERYRFAVTSLGTLAFNGVIIAGLVIGSWFGDLRQLLTILVWTVVGGATLRLIMQVIDWRMSGGGHVLRGRWLPDRRLLIGYVQVLGTGAAVLLVPLIARRYASGLGDGAIATFTYASKLFELPLAVLITVVSSAIFPRLSQLAAGTTEADRDAGDRLMGLGLVLVLVASLASAIGLGLFAGDVAGVVFGRSTIAPEGIARIGVLTTMLLTALPAAGVASVITTWCNARGDTRSPFLVSLVAVGIFVVGAQSLTVEHRLAGLAAATVALHLAIAVPLLVLAWRRTRCRATTILRQTLPALIATVLGTLPACGLSLMVADPTVRTLLAGAAIAGGILAGTLAVPDLRQWARQRLRRA